MKILTCTCCGAEITAPQFFNGKPYGWTCIKKVNPAAKQVKLKFVAVEKVEIVRQRAGRSVMYIWVDGKKLFKDVAESQMCEQNGQVFIREDVFGK